MASWFCGPGSHFCVDMFSVVKHNHNNHSKSFTSHFLQYPLPTAAVFLCWWSWMQSSVDPRTNVAAGRRGHRPPAGARRRPVRFHHPLLRLEPWVIPAPCLSGAGGGWRGGLIGHSEAHFFMMHFFHLDPFIRRRGCGCRLSLRCLRTDATGAHRVVYSNLT